VIAYGSVEARVIRKKAKKKNKNKKNCYSVRLIRKNKKQNKTKNKRAF
jgi:hypothetical protein